jgi:hypothetical protein
METGETGLTKLYSEMFQGSGSVLLYAKHVLSDLIGMEIVPSSASHQAEVACFSLLHCSPHV